MIRRFLLCVFLWQCMIGGDAKIEEAYNGPECEKRLDPQAYLYTYQGLQFPTKKNGNPHYLWGIPMSNDKVVYCARITSEVVRNKKAKESLKIPNFVHGFSIHSIEIHDRKWPPKGGNVNIVARKDLLPIVYVDFESEINEQMDYVVVFIGR